MNEPLRELFLADNKLMPSDGVQLGSLLKFNHKLKLLDMRNNHLGVSRRLLVTPALSLCVHHVVISEYRIVV